MSRKQLLGNVDRVVIKIGTTSLMQGRKTISIDFMDSVAEQVKALREEGKEVLIVTSGAIGVGLRAMKVQANPNDIPIRQAAASVGQSILMQRWSDSFQRQGMLVGQVLMSLDTYSDRDSAINLNNTINSLLENGVVPIFNENDAVCITEIKFGDNDTLSAIVASRTDADLLVILSDVKGLYDSDPTKNPDAKLVPEVRNLDQSVRAMAGDSSTGLGTGGMRTKLDAAEICKDAGCSMIIASSKEQDAVYRAVTGDDIGTIFVSDNEITKKRRWIKSAHASGTLTIDTGAVKAVLDHKSLLPVGIRSVEGSFDKGEVVDIVCDGQRIAKGIANYGSKDMSAIAGKHSADLEAALGRKDHKEAILAENLVVL
ncbi:glutamate 5-kinase ProB [methanogenic archaeon mixed culture ISO4-G1]|nr:glutamate 5-kinase ProB [methanogenic archaeon mixed culture ISO4-G1]